MSQSPMLCPHCKNKFLVTESETGGTPDWEDITCPYCKKVAGRLRTSGSVSARKQENETTIGIDL